MQRWWWILWLVVAGCLSTRTPALVASAPAPPFALTSHDGNKVSLSDMLAKGPAVVVFYRGFWWPFCRSQLGELAEHKADFDKRGAALVAISVDDPADSRAMARELGIDFPLLWDPELTVASAYGVAMRDKDIAVPSVFVISPRGRIVWRQVGETPLDRADLDDVLAQLERR